MGDSLLKRLIAGLAVSAFVFSATGCAQQEPLTSRKVVVKLDEAGIDCDLSQLADSVSCRDPEGEEVFVRLYFDLPRVTLEERMKQDFSKICAKVGGAKTSEWAEGPNWRAYGTWLVSAEDLANALGGSVKARDLDCN